MKWVNKGREFVELSKRIIELAENNKCYIWGAGFFGDAIFKTLSNDINVIGYVDSDVNKQEKMKNGVEVLAPSVLMENLNVSSYVLVAAGWTREIFSELNRMGYKKNIDYFHIDEFLQILMFYKYDKLYLSNVGVQLSEKCTLKCEKCLALLPYVEKPRNYSLDEVDELLNKLFKVVDNISTLALCGGDAMLNPNSEAIIKRISNNYVGTKIDTIELYTNAVIMPSENYLETLKQNEIYVRFTDYGVDKQKIGEMKKLMIDNNIRYDLVKFDTWCDMGYPQESNGIIGEDELARHFERCDRRSCQLIADNRYYFCGQAYNAERAAYCTGSEHDYVDLNSTNLDRAAFLEFALGYSTNGYLEYCKKCNGSLNINKHKIVPGVQLK